MSRWNLNQTFVVAALTALLLASGVGLAASHAEPGDDTLSGTVFTTAPIDISGRASVEADQGVLHAHADLGQVTLQADRISVNYTWRNGVKPAAGVGPTPSRLVVETGQDFINRTGVQAHLTAFQDVPQVLAMLDPAEGSLSSDMDGQGSAAAVQNEQLARVERSDQEQSLLGSQPLHGFHYSVDGSEAALDSFDEAHLEGDFTLFFNNMTLEGATDQGTLDHWSGNRETRTSPGVRSFESRVTVVTVTNGTLTVRAPDQVTVVSPEATLSLAGALSTSSARGQLLDGATKYLYDGDPSTIRGIGVGNLSVASESGVGALGLSLSLEGPFTVPDQGNPEPLAPQRQGEHSGVLDWLPWLGVLLTLPLVAVGAATAGRRLDRPGDGRPQDPRMQELIPADTRDAGELLREGRDLYQAGATSRAISRFQALVERYPENPEGWYWLGEIYLEEGRLEEASQAYERYDAAMGGDEPDALVGLVRVAGEQGRGEEAGRWLIKLSRISPAQAGAIASQPRYATVGFHVLEELEPDAIEAWARRLQGSRRREDARELAIAVARRRPAVLFRLAETEAGAEISRMAVNDLDPSSLSSLVKVAWSYDRLGLASDGFLELARRAPCQASELADDPMYEPLAHDARLASVLPRAFGRGTTQ